MVNFGPLAADICWRVWGTPANFNGFRILAENFNGFCVVAALLHGTLAVGVSQTATGRPSRLAFAHILVDVCVDKDGNAVHG